MDESFLGFSLCSGEVDQLLSCIRLLVLDQGDVLELS